MGFSYNYVPAFSLNVGDTIAFDTGNVNDVNICRSIYFSQPTYALPGCSTSTYNVNTWTPVTGLQCVGYGDSTIGNYDLSFNVTTAFSFAGGYLSIGFSAAGAQVDLTCTQVRTRTATLPRLTHLYTYDVYLPSLGKLYQVFYRYKIIAKKWSC